MSADPQADLFGKSQRDAFWRDLRAGNQLNCPCCERFATIYHRQIHSGIALQLIKLYRHGGYAEYVHVSCVLAPGSSGVGDFSKPRYWELIEPKDHIANETKSSGYWRLTMKGTAFVRSKLKIPRFALVFDDTVLRFEGDDVSISDCLGKKFNYTELMQGKAA